MFENSWTKRLEDYGEKGEETEEPFRFKISAK